MKNQDAKAMEKERKKLLQSMDQHISDELKNAIDIAYKLSKKKPPNPNLFFTDGSSTDGDAF